MKSTIRIHQHPRTSTHLPAHERAARHHRATSTLPRAPRHTPRPAPAPGGRKTIDTRPYTYRD